VVTIPIIFKLQVWANEALEEAEEKAEEAEDPPTAP